MSNHAAFFFLFVLLSGCTSNPENQATTSSHVEVSKITGEQAAVKQHKKTARPIRSRIVCTDETPTGTHFSKRVCRSVAQRNAESRDARALYDDLTDSIYSN